jgi:hypothetical protein
MKTNVEQGTPNQAVAPIMRDTASMTERAIPSSVSKFRPAHSQTQLAASRTQIARATEPLYKVPPSHYLNGCTHNCWTLPTKTSPQPCIAFAPQKIYGRLLHCLTFASK